MHTARFFDRSGSGSPYAARFGGRERLAQRPTTTSSPTPRNVLSSPDNPALTSTSGALKEHD